MSLTPELLISLANGVLDHWRLHRLGGGHGIEHWQALDPDGRSLFVKACQEASPALAAEGQSLERLGQVTGVRVPTVHFCSDRCLVLDHIQPGGRADHSAAALATLLAHLHAERSERFGFSCTTWCGATPQDNRWTSDGHAFFADQRILPLAIQARDRGLLDATDLHTITTFCNRLPDLIPAQPASLVHGDLWLGNILFDQAGDPWLIDPAAAFGWAEADLAMTRLFGSLPEAVYDRYREATGLAMDWEERIPAYNAYHLLNHLLLFGGGYGAAAMQAIRRYC